MTEKRYDERGYLLFETALALPLIIFLLAALTGATMWSFRAYQRQTADLNTQAELQAAMVRVVEDVKNAETLEVTPREQKFHRVYIEMRREREQAINPANIRYRAEYDVRRLGGGNFRRLTGDGGDPITGDSFGGATDVTEFTLERKADDLARVTLAMSSVSTGREYRLSTEVYLRRVRWLQ